MIPLHTKSITQLWQYEAYRSIWFFEVLRMRKTYQITEYGSFVRDREVPGYISAPGHLWHFELCIVEQHWGHWCIKADGRFCPAKVSVKSSQQKLCRRYYDERRHYDRDTTKIFLTQLFTDEEKKREKVKKLLIDMLKTLRNTPFKSLQATNVNIDKLSIFEIFIRMFVDEVFYIVKRGWSAIMKRSNPTRMSSRANGFRRTDQAQLCS